LQKVGNTQRELLLALGFRMGRKYALSRLGEHLAARDRDLAELRARFDNDVNELRSMLHAASQKLFHLQQLNRCERAAPPTVLH
jgi:hypothetical protein